MKFIVHYKYLKISVDGSSYKSIEVDEIECDEYIILNNLLKFYNLDMANEHETIALYNIDSVIKVEVQSD